MLFDNNDLAPLGGTAAAGGSSPLYHARLSLVGLLAAAGGGRWRAVAGGGGVKMVHFFENHDDADKTSPLIAH